MHTFIKTIALFLMLATPATSQGVFDIGVLTNTLSIDTSPRANTKKEAPPLSANRLSFQFSDNVRRQYLTQFLTTIRSNDPIVARDIENILLSTDAIDRLRSEMKSAGLKSNNIADVYAVYWTKAWLGARGRKDNLSTAQIITIRNRVATAMLSTPVLLAQTDAQKQELAEAMFIQSALIPAFIESTKSAPVQLAQMKMAIAKGAKNFGLDLEKMTLTAQGFRSTKK
jgi:hypothetical protein